MLRRRQALLIRPELDDHALHTTLDELRQGRQLHGLGAGRTRPLWEPVADLLKATGRDWDRRVHRIAVLARNLPPSVGDRWSADRPGDGDALVLGAWAGAVSAAAKGRGAVREAERACLRAAECCPEDPTPWLALLELMHALSVPPRHAVPVWSEAVTRAPWLRTAYHQLLRHLSPRGHGTVADMLDFARQAAARAPHGSPLALLPVTARVELVAHRQQQMPLGAERHWHEPRAAHEVAVALSDWFLAATTPHAEAVADLNLLELNTHPVRRSGTSSSAGRLFAMCTAGTWRTPCGRAETGRAATARPTHRGRRGLEGVAATGSRAVPHAWGTPAVARVRVARRRWASRARAQRAETVAA